MPLSSEQLSAAIALRAEHPEWGWERVATKIGSSYYLVRGELDPPYRARVLNAANSRRRRKHKLVANMPKFHPTWQPSRHVGESLRQPTVPSEVLADRDRRRELAPRSITAALCGDPPAGYSALDRRRGS